MNLIIFTERLKEASVLHNIALINKRTQNYQKSNQCYQQAVQLYQSCYDHYNSIPDDDVANAAELEANGAQQQHQNHQRKSSNPPINLELKISQTYQSMAKVYECLNDEMSSVRAHEDAITLLIEGSNDDGNDHEDGSSSSQEPRQRDAAMHVDMNMNMNMKRQQRAVDDKSYHSPKKNPSAIHGNISPDSVMDPHLSPSPSRSTATATIKSQYNIVKLTTHERTRITSVSLTSLAHLYFRQECNQGIDHVEEDPLRYYQEALNFLKTVPNPISNTYISALSNDKGSGVGFHRINSGNESDANLTVSSFGKAYAIDLRKDIANILVEMGTLYKRRKDHSSAIKVLEQARDMRLLLNSNINEQEMIESSLGVTYERMGAYGKAFTCYQHVLKVRKIMFGDKSLPVANLYASMSNLHRKDGDFAQSLSWNKMAIQLYEVCEKKTTATTPSSSPKTNKRSKNPDFNLQRNIIGSYQNQGCLYVEMNELDRAIASYLISIEKQIAFQGEEHPDVARTLNVLGDLYLTKNDLVEAKAIFSRALKLYRKYGVEDSDPDMVCTLECLCEIESHVNDSNGGNVRNTNIPKSDTEPRRKTPPLASPRLITTSTRSRQDYDAAEVENGFCAVIETDPHFLEDDDAVSQITFLTHKDPPPKREQQGDWIENNLEKYVFQAVDRIANGLNQVTESFLSGPQQRLSGCRPSSPRVTQKKSVIVPIVEEEDDEEGYEVREFESRLLEPILQISTKVTTPETSLSTKLDSENCNTDCNSGIFAHLTSCDLTKSFDHDAATRIDTTRDVSIVHDDDSVANNTLVSSVLHGMKIPDDGTGVSLAGTYASSTLHGLNLPTDDHSLKRMRDNLHPIQEKDTKTPMIIDTNEIDAPKNRAVCNMDDLLAQMNVVTCDMEEDDAVPFQELLKGESTDDKPTIEMKQDETFEKMSLCLDKLIELKDKHGPSHTKVINTMFTLAELYVENGDNAKGVKKYEEIVDLCQSKYGRNSLQVSDVHVKLGEYYCKERESTNAIEYFSRAKDILVYLYGNTNPRIAQMLNRMGMAELGRNDFDVAMDYFQEALKIQKLNLEPNEINPDVSATYVNIGSVYYKERNSVKTNRTKKDSYKSFIESGMLEKIAFAHSERGEYLMAMNFYEESLLNLQNSQGSKGQGNTGTPNTRKSRKIIETLKFLGDLNIKVSRFSTAKDYYEQGMSSANSSTKITNVEVANIKADVGVVEYSLGNFKKATQILELSLSVQRSFLGSENPRVAKTVYHIGVVKRKMCDFERSLVCLNDALRIQQSILKENHPDTIFTEMELGKLLLDSDKVDDAIFRFENIFTKQRNLFGDEHPDLAETMYYIGICCTKQRDLTKAMKYFERCYLMQHKAFKVDCPQTASTLDQIGQVLLSSRKFEKARKVLEESLQIRRDICEAGDHYQVVYSLISMGQLCTSERKYKDAMYYFKDAMRVAVRSFTLEHPIIAEIHCGVGNLNTRKCLFEEAKNEFILALEIYGKTLIPATHEKVVKAKDDLKRAEHEEALCV
uniref:Uncharacterized protein n=1 Tax=Chaetoceros debilis TaxID=122233 RepID=A0A7S3VEI9_9STRA